MDLVVTQIQDSMGLSPEVKKMELSKPLQTKWTLYKNFKKTEIVEQVRCLTLHFEIFPLSKIDFSHPFLPFCFEKIFILNFPSQSL